MKNFTVHNEYIITKRSINNVPNLRGDKIMMTVEFLDNKVCDKVELKIKDDVLVLLSSLKGKWVYQDEEYFFIKPQDILVKFK